MVLDRVEVPLAPAERVAEMQSQSVESRMASHTLAQTRASHAKRAPLSFSWELRLSRCELRYVSVSYRPLLNLLNLLNLHRVSGIGPARNHGLLQQQGYGTSPG